MGEVQRTGPPAPTGPYWDRDGAMYRSPSSAWALLGWEWCNSQVPPCSNWAILGWRQCHAWVPFTLTGPYWDESSAKHRSPCSNWIILGWGQRKAQVPFTLTGHYWTALGPHAEAPLPYQGSPGVGVLPLLPTSSLRGHPRCADTSPRSWSVWDPGCAPVGCSRPWGPRGGRPPPAAPSSP